MDSPSAVQLLRSSATWQRLLAVAAAVAAALGAWAYWPALARTGAAWTSNPDYTHGFFVVPLSLWFLWRSRSARPDARPDGWLLGSCLLALAAGVRWLSARFYLPEVDAWTIPIWIAGVVTFLGGRELGRWAAPSIAFLWFATPIPGTVETWLSAPLQLMAANTSAVLLQALGQPAIVEGTTILLDEQVLDVERACSGLRMFYGIAALAVASIILFRPSRWKSFLLLLAAAPVGIAANVVRITVTGLLQKYASGEVAKTFSHDLAGLLMIPLAVAMFLGFLALLNRTAHRLETDRAAATLSLARQLVAVAVAAAALFLWWRYQQQRSFSTLLETATRFEREQDWFSAADYLNRYVTARPADHEALVHLAETYSKAALLHPERTRAVELYRVAWEAFPDRHELGRRGLELALEAGEFRTALRLADRLAEAAQQRDDAPLRDAAIAFRADALLGYLRSEQARLDYNWNDAAQALQDVLEGPNAESHHYAALAEIYRDRLAEPRQSERYQLADSLMDRLVRDHADDPRAWLARYQYRRRYGRIDPESPAPSADDDLERAIDLSAAAADRTRIDVLLAAASRSQERSQTDEAIQFLDQAIAVPIPDHRPYEMLASVYRQRGTAEGRQHAIAALKDGLTRLGRQELALVLPFASTLAEDGRFDEARAQLLPLENALPLIESPERGVVALGVALVRAQIAAQQGHLDDAIGQLSTAVNSVEVRLAAGRIPTMLGGAWQLLGQLFEQVKSPDRAMQAYQQAGRLAPALADWRLPLARSAAQAGDFDLAIGQYQLLVAEHPEHADAWLALGNSLLQRQVRRGRVAAEWRDVAQAIDKAQHAGAGGVSIALLSADLMLARNATDQAVELLQAVTQKAPGEPRLWRGLALSQRRAGLAEQALAAAQRYAELAPDSVDAASIRAGLLVQLGRTDEAREVLRRLATVDDPTQRVQALLALAGLHSQLGERSQVRTLLEQAYAEPQTTREGKYELANALALFAWEEQDWDALERYEELLEQVEGPSGALRLFYRAERLLDQATSLGDASYEEVSGIVRELSDSRPRWATTHLLAGDVASRRGQIDAAIAAYERAWELGGRNVLLAENLIALLTQQARFAEAGRYIDQVRDFLENSPQLFDQTIPYYARSDQREHALHLAQQWVDRSPQDPSAHMRLGRVLIMLAEVDPADQGPELLRQAEDEFQLAVELAPTDVRTWVACFAYYARVLETRDRALETLSRLAKQIDMNPIHKEFVLAQLYESLGDPPAARQHYRTSVKLADELEDPKLAAAVLSRAAQACRRFEPHLAEDYCRRALELDETSDLAKQVLAELLIRTGDQAALAESLRLLDSQAQGGAELSGVARRMRAQIVAHPLGGNDTQRAIRLLEGALQKDRDDRLLLASFYEQSDRVAPAFELLDDLATSTDARPQDLAAYLQFWQTHFASDGRFSRQAQAVYDHLAQTAGGFGERLRWKIREQKLRNPAPAGDSELLPVIDALWQSAPFQGASDDQQRHAMFQTALVVLLQEGAADEAHRLSRQPPSFLPANVAVRLLCNALILVPPSAALKSEADQLVAEACSSSNDVELLSAAADYAFMNGDYEIAAARYQKLLAIEPRRVLALNNLALAMIECREDPQQAEKILKQALDIKPDDPGLLDSRAILDLHRGQPRQALQTLRQVVTARPTDPSARLHLAAAQRALGNDDDARESFLDALSLDLTSQLLSPSDRQAVEAMRKIWSL